MTERHAELCAAFADGSLSEAECAELLAAAEANPEIAQAIADDLELHRQLELTAGSAGTDERKNAERILYYVRAKGESAEFGRRVEERIRQETQNVETRKVPSSKRVRPPSARRRRSHATRSRPTNYWGRAALAASAAIAVTVYFVLAQRPAVPVAPALPEEIGEIVCCYPLEKQDAPSVVVRRDGKSEPARAQERIRSGDRVEARGGGLRLRFLREATTLELKASATVRLEATEAGKRVRLDEGELDATVAKQPVGMPMTFLTPHAEATVLGTSLTLVTDPAESCLKVTEGSVRFAQGGDQVVVNTGEFAVAAPGQKLVVQQSAQKTEPVGKAEPTEVAEPAMPWRINPQARSVFLSWQKVPELNRELVRVEYTNEVNNLRAIISKPFTLKPDAKQLRIRVAFLSYEPNVMMSVLLTERDGSTWYMTYHKPGESARVPWTELVVSLAKPAKKNNDLGDDNLDVDQVARIALGFARGKAVVLLDEIIVE
jgi:hypothetical protein